MKITRFFLLIFIAAFIFSAMHIHAQDGKSGITLDVPTGMEVKKAGPVDFVIPQGAEVHDDGGVISIESTPQYMSRKFIEIKNRFDKLEAEQARLEDLLVPIKKEENLTLE